MAGRLQRMYEREREIARTLQGMLVSPLPSAWGPFAFADYYRAGSPDADVGGDFYALFPLPDGRLGLLFGDIGGRGLEAAAKIAGLRYAMEAYAREGTDPAEMMAQANHIICEAEFQIATLAYLILDPADGTVEMTNAGHEPPLVRRGETGAWEALPGAGPALGVIPTMTFTSTRLRLRPGDLLLLYTDGVASVGPKQGDWSTEDLLERARTLPPAAPPAETVRGLSDLLAEGEDDAALAALRWSPPPPAGGAPG
jgi:serine phosphatase RsbU (regulator of sigma subunit)